MTDLRAARAASVIRLFAHAPHRELQPKPGVKQPEFDLGDDLDEVLIGSWFHLEWMTDDHCWMRIGDAALNVHFSSGGRVEVSVRLSLIHISEPTRPY